MKKIVVYINSMAAAGGIERVVADLFNMLAISYSITFIVKDNNSSFFPLNEQINMIKLNKPLYLDMKKSKFVRMISIFFNHISTKKNLKNLLQKIEPNFIYVVFPTNALEIFFTMSKKTKLIISEHGSYFGYNRFYTLLKKIIYPKAYKLIIPSKTDTIIYKKLHYPAKYIPHLLPFDKSACVITSMQYKTVLNIGRFTDDKRQLLLLQIWKNVMYTNTFSDWKLILVGTGENENKIRSYIHNNSLSDSVIMKHPISDIGSLYLNASIFAFTSRFEGFGMVLLEAMFHGLPCISFDCPSGPRDIIMDKVNGFLIPNGNTSVFSERLQDLMNNLSLREEMSKEAAKTAINWDNTNIINQWKAIL